jgi:ubiquinol-cytochrome c reductase cytochrome b subunit
VQVFLYGAYKKPRETTWIVGVVLLLVTLAYGLTGYLLPWDNRAYWGTVVTTRIAALAPGMGPYIQRLMGSTAGSVGVVTFARFYGLHVLLLPPATLFLIGLHVYLVRKHGVAPAPGDERLASQQFYPRQAFRDTVAIFIAFAVLFTMAVAARVPLEQLADPTAAYTPRPEWYFLFLFQTLKLFPGPLEVVGAVVLPGLAMLAIVLVPFIDRTRMVNVTRRTVAMSFVALAGLTWTGLTAAAVLSDRKQPQPVAIDYSAPTDWMQLSPEEMAGVAYFRQENCISCHVIGEHGHAVGPDLTRITIHKDAAWMIDHFKRPSTLVPGSAMPPIQLSDAQLNSLAAFLLKLNPNNATALDNAPEFATQGALVYQANHCDACHMVNGGGMRVGPPLNGLARRQSLSWVKEHFADPGKLSPGSIMPPYKLSPKDMESLTSYLFALPE